ncbi:hypothetical protein A3E49_02895 [Candidatus Saccharibacteria bacterium RIFCSPHIGHO2_12_FULL_49_19]|nr:MAG: hypothetical protein A3E49_02895 [Candidatus Saccharibacteria bacterium RIFCSPHIGHO2_12_FULL_49_19]
MNPQSINNPQKTQTPAQAGAQPFYPPASYGPEPEAPPYPGNTPANPQVVAAPPSANVNPVNPNSTQNSLQIAEIRDGIVIMNDGTFRAVIMCKSINFDLMSPQEREAVEYAYQGVLNSLYFPIQIFMRSQKVDLRPYLEKLDKIRSEQENMLLGLLMEDYVAFLADISQQTNIMDKNFYVTVQYPDPDEEDIKSTIEQSKGFFKGMFGLFGGQKETVQRVVIDENRLETAKTELRNRVQALMQGLMDSGVHSLPLDTQELIELFYDVYNPDTATRQHMRDFNELTAPVVTKGVGNAPQPGLDREAA